MDPGVPWVLAAVAVGVLLTAGDAVTAGEGTAGT